MAAFLVVALIPLVMTSINVYRDAWSDAWREVREKHQLLAENLALPISIYVDNHRRALVMVAHRLSSVSLDQETEIKPILVQALSSMEGFGVVMVMKKKARLHYCVNRQGDVFRQLNFDQHDFFKELDAHDSGISHVMQSPLSKKPALFISTPINRDAVLVASLGIGQIEKLRRNIKFGKKGHSAIVDDLGRVIAHPNPKWMQSMEDLSHLSVVQRMMQGDTGVIEFYSPFIKKNMVAGYTAVPGLGWGVMVPQPRSEMEEVVNNIMKHQFTWGVVGFVLAVTVAFVISRRISGPINALAAKAHQLSENNFRRMQPLPRRGPLEIRQLADMFEQAVDELVESRLKVQDLNQSLQIEVDIATNELRQANEKLEQQATRDYLTKLANRRHFETCFNRTLDDMNLNKRPYMLLLLDVDNFKYINDNFGHFMGDEVLSTLAEILRDNVREQDMVARYGGDEFIALIHANREVAWQRAEKINQQVQSHEFVYEGKPFRVTTSMGVLMLDELTDPGLKDEFFRRVDQAMYKAKRMGRNTIVEVDKLA